jgi:hypothetical protein
MSFLRPIWQDMRARKLVPVAAVLLLAIVAVPVVLSSSSSAPVAGRAVAPSGPVTAGLPAVSDSSAPSTAVPRGHSRDPFGPSSAAGGPGSATPTTTTAATPVTGSTAAGSGSTGAQGSTGGSGSTTGGGSTTPSTGGQTPSGPTTIPTPKPKPTTAALTPYQAYAVSLAITNSAGGVNTIKPLERLSPLPTASQPLLVELGVLRGGSHVLFAVQPGTVLSGPGECIPGPIDCEIVSLAQAQTEKLSVHTAKGIVRVALFAVTGISAVNQGSRSAALTVRDRASSRGRQVLNRSSLNALSLFHYEPSVGAVVDLRNLTLRNS